MDTKKSLGYDLLEILTVALALFCDLFNAICKPKYHLTQKLMIAKLGKHHTQASTYRTIRLLPYLRKSFERILLSKIYYFLQRKKVISEHQIRF